MNKFDDPTLLCQDKEKKLFNWFASRVDAKETLRRVLGGEFNFKGEVKWKS